MWIITASFLPRQVFASLYCSQKWGKGNKMGFQTLSICQQITWKKFLTLCIYQVFIISKIPAFSDVCSQKAFIRHKVFWHYGKQDSTQPWLSNHLFPLHTYHRGSSSFFRLHELWSLTPLLFRLSFGLFLAIWPSSTNVLRNSINLGTWGWVLHRLTQNSMLAFHSEYAWPSHVSEESQNWMKIVNKLTEEPH